MAITFVIACPDCGKQVKVSDEHIGKRVKCKNCGTVFPVTSGGNAGPPPPPPPPPKGPKAPAKAEKPKSELDDDEAGPKQYTMQQDNDFLPRCPFCAKEMESAEAMICLNCGYNTRTRQRPEVKAIYQASGFEVFLWLLPGILTVLVMIGMLVWYLIFWNKIEDWMADSWFEDEPGPPKVWIAGFSPGFFRLYQALLILFLYVPCFRFAYKRLVKNNKPPERKIKEELY